VQIKKVMILFLAGILIETSVYARSIPEPPFSGGYIDTNLGYAHIDWRNYAIRMNNFTAAASPTANTRGGVSVGVDGGYQWNHLWAIEAAWYYLPYVSGTWNGVPATAHAWLFYAATKLSIAIHESTYLFGKWGAAVRNTHLSANGTLTQSTTGQPLPISAYYWAPLFGVGLQYFITRNWSINIQYLFMAGYDHAIAATARGRLNVPDLNLLSIGLGFKFAT